jgi:hypothetical protein
MTNHLRMLQVDDLELIGRTEVQYLADYSARQYIDREEARSWEWTVYAHVIGDIAVRIGKCECSLEQSAKDWERLVSRAMNGDFQIGGTNPWEAYHWRRRLMECGGGKVLARRGRRLEIRSPEDKRGAQNALRRERSLLIKKYNPPLCHDTPTARKRPRVATGVRNLTDAKDYHLYLLGLEQKGHPAGIDAEFQWAR